MYGKWQTHILTHTHIFKRVGIWRRKEVEIFEFCKQTCREQAPTCIFTLILGEWFHLKERIWNQKSFRSIETDYSLIIATF